MLNKTDLLPPEKREAMLEKITKKLKLTFQKTKFKEVDTLTVHTAHYTLHTAHCTLHTAH